MEAATVVHKPTTKQAKVLGMLAKGKTTTEIAKAMKISTNGVYGHMRKLRDKGLLDANGAPTTQGKAATNGPPDKVNGSPAPDAALALVEKILSNARQVADDRLDEIAERLKAIEAERAALTEEGVNLEAEAQALRTALPQDDDIPF